MTKVLRMEKYFVPWFIYNLYSTFTPISYYIICPSKQFLNKLTKTIIISLQRQVTKNILTLYVMLVFSVQLLENRILSKLFMNKIKFFIWGFTRNINIITHETNISLETFRLFTYVITKMQIPERNDNTIFGVSHTLKRSKEEWLPINGM